VSCGPSSGPKDPAAARRPLPSSEVTLGGEDTHSSPSKSEMAEMIGPPAFVRGTVPASGCEAFCQEQKPQQPQKVPESAQTDRAKSPLQKQKLSHRPRSSSFRGRRCTNKGGFDAQFFQPSMQQSISNVLPACKRKQLAPVRQSLFCPHQATTTGVADLSMPLQPVLASGGSKITNKQKHGRSASEASTGLAVRGKSCGPPQLMTEGEQQCLFQ